MRREQQRQNTVSTLNSLSLTEDKPELIHAETGQARGKYVCVCAYYVTTTDLYVLRAGVSVNAGGGGEEMEEIQYVWRLCRPYLGGLCRVLRQDL